ncbi:PLP-dependent aminotransferase family protein [Xylanimonas protaetiae]|uniref:PLP-dependent aminotransferase family protein n=1 Tax=Xylanimonas protaetiae TaxID=2509457 RepID=A0A4P6FLT2_9MICO|nr:PLP-dependent aminotransferase family protein [Xylanimonas protaetiae]QAY71598.1 PLP-dependent aminotransferase family protein [Xylanimonas protaetiae]
MTADTRVLAGRVRGLAAPTRFGAVLGAPPADSIALTSGSPDVALLPAEQIAAATARVLADPRRAAVALDYSHRPGHAGLRAWLAEREGVSVDRVVLTNGALHALALPLLAVVEPGDVVVVENPVYPLLLGVLQLTGARVEAVPTDADGLDVDALERRLADGLRPRALYVVPDFQNPTGATLSAPRRARLVELAERYGFLVLSDNPYTALRWAGDRPADLDLGSDRVVHANTFSKVFGPGLRLGWAVLPEWVTPGVLDLRARTDQHASSLVQEIVADLVLVDDLYDVVAQRAASEYARRAAALVEGLRAALGTAVSVDLPDGGLFAWVHIGPGADALAARLGDHGVLVSPGSQFVVPGSPAADGAAVAEHLRVSFARHGLDTLAEAVRRFTTAHARAALEVSR